MKLLKLFLAFAVVLALLVAGALFFLTRFVQAPSFKEQVLESAREATGRDVKIREMNVSLFSGIDLREVEVSDLLTAKSFTLRYRLLPLLRKRVEVESLILDTPVIKLEEHENKKEPDTARSPSARKPSKTSGSSLDIALEHLELKHASLTMVRHDKELLRVTDANFTSAVEFNGD